MFLTSFFEYNSSLLHTFMSFANTDVKFYLSGGAFNQNPDASLGGIPSSQQVGDKINNLFAKVNKTEIASGGQAYRCIYIANTGSDTMNDVSVWVEGDSETLSSATLGTTEEIEVQRILIGGTPVGGTFTLRYTVNVDSIPVSQETDPIQFVPVVEDLAANVQTALNDLALLDDVEVEGTIVDGQWQLMVEFGGSHSYRYHNILEVASNNIVGQSTIGITMITEGGPVNLIAPDVGFENQSPAGVTFSDTTITIGTLEPSDIFPLWMVRTTPSGTEASDTSLDQFEIKLSADV